MQLITSGNKVETSFPTVMFAMTYIQNERKDQDFVQLQIFLIVCSNAHLLDCISLTISLWIPQFLPKLVIFSFPIGRKEFGISTCRGRPLLHFCTDLINCTHFLHIRGEMERMLVIKSTKVPIRTDL